MNKFPRKHIGEITRTIGGGTPTRSNAEYYNGNIPWVTPKDMKSREIWSSKIKITEEGVKNSTTKIAPKKSVLIVNRSGILKHTVPVGVNQVPVAINQDMKALVCSDEISPEYLAYFIKHRSSEILRWVRATTADNFPISNLKEMEIAIPPAIIQERIVQHLDRAAAVQAQRARSIELLDELTQCTFLEMFGDTAHWNHEKLGDIADIQGGLQVTAKRKTQPMELPYLRVANVYRNSLNLQEIKSIRASQKEVSRTALKKGDLLIVEGHGNPQEIGRVAVWDGSIEHCTHQNHLIRARADTTRILPEFASGYLNSPTGRNYLLRSSKTTSGLHTISTNNVRSCPIITPPIEDQIRYTEFLEKIDAQKKKHQAHLAHLDELFASVQQRAFDGTLWDDRDITS